MRKGSEQENFPPDHILVLLEGLRRRTVADLLARIDANSAQVRGSHVRLLQMIPREGVSITALAATADMHFPPDSLVSQMRAYLPRLMPVGARSTAITGSTGHRCSSGSSSSPPTSAV